MAIQAPTGLTATSISKDQIDLSWNNTTPPFYDFIEIWRAKDSDSGYQKIDTIDGANASYSDPSYPNPDLTDGTKYYYFVRALYAEEQADSNKDSAITDLPAPSGLSATKDNPNKIILNWTNNSSVYSWVLIERKETCPGSTGWSQVGGPSGDNETWNDTTVKDGRTYEYRIRGKKNPNDVYSSYSGTVSETTKLYSPNNLQGTSANDGSYVDLSWNDRSETETGVEIYRDEAKIHTTGENETSYRDNGVSPKTTYEYKVRALGDCLNSQYSDTIEVYTDAPPNAPSGLDAEAQSTTQINLSWNDNSDDEDGFKIEEKVGAGSFSQIDTVGANVTSYERTGLSPGTNYTYRVRAYNAAGNSEYSNEAESTTQSDISKPTNPSATPISDTEIEITFQDNSSAEDDHRIERKPDGGSYSEIKTLEANRTYYKDTGLTKGQKYYYRIRAKQGVNYSDYSNEVSATTIEEPSAPSNLSAEAESDEKIRLIWDDNSDNETGFKIEQSDDEGSSWNEIAVIGADIEEFLVTGLNAGTRYDFRIRAYNAAGNSAYSGTAHTTTDSEYEMTEFEKFARDPNAKPVFLAEVNPKMELSGWSLVSGKTYTYEYTITDRGIDIEDILENGEKYTEKTSVSDVESNASTFYCDYYNRILYVHTSDGSDPSGYYMEASFWMYFSNYQNQDGDVIYNGNYYFPYLDLENIPDVSSEIKRLYEGNASLSSGDLIIRNPRQGDGTYFFDKKFEQYIWINRQARLKAGKIGFTYSQFKTIYTGLMGSVICTDRSLSLPLEDIREGLSRTLPINKFWQSNYSDLPDTEQGRPIPVLFGSIANSPLIQIESANKKYKFHDGRVKSVTAVKDKDGTTLTKNTDYYVDLQNAIITFAEGYTIGDDDYFTIDFEGIPDSAGDLIQNGADIYRYIYNEFLGLSDSELDLDSIYETKYDKEKNLSVFMYLQKSSNTYIREIEHSLEAYSFQTEEGKIGLRTFSSTVPSDVKYIEDHQIFDFKQEMKRRDILYQVNVFYSENPQDQSWSVKTGVSNTIQWGYRITEEAEVYTRLTTSAQAQTMVNAILALLNKCTIQFSIRHVLYGCRAGDLVRLTRSRYYNSDGLASEKTLRILEIEISYSEGKTSITAEEVS